MRSWSADTSCLRGFGLYTNLPPGPRPAHPHHTCSPLDNDFRRVGHDGARQLEGPRSGGRAGAAAPHPIGWAPPSGSSVRSDREQQPVMVHTAGFGPQAS